MTAALVDPQPLVITEPGLYDGISDDDYHRDPVPSGSLSSTGARRLLAPSCPAKYRYAADNPPANTDTFDFGHAAHALVLGVGMDIVVVEADNWMTKAAKEQKTAAHAAGKTPLLRKDMDIVEAMAKAIKQNALAMALLDPDNGKAEQSAFWQDDEHGVWRRVRFDWLPDPRDNGRMIVPDYKTGRSAQPEAFAKAAADYGYHQQAPYYLDAIDALGLAESAAFVFIVQEKTAPYVVTVCELDETALRIGRGLNREALQVFAHCQRTGTWPDYTAGDVAHISLPPWFVRQHELYL